VFGTEGEGCSVCEGDGAIVWEGETVAVSVKTITEGMADGGIYLLGNAEGVDDITTEFTNEGETSGITIEAEDVG